MVPLRELPAGMGVYVCSLGERAALPSSWSRALTTSPGETASRKCRWFQRLRLVRLWIRAHASFHATFGRFLRWYFYGPLCLAVTCSIRFLSGEFSRIRRIQRFLVRQWIRYSLRRLLCEFLLFLRGFTRILRSILVLLSVVFSLSLLRARFEEWTWTIRSFGTCVSENSAMLGPQWYMLCVSYGVCCLLVDAPVVQVVCLPVVMHDRSSDYADSRSYSSGRSGECWVSGCQCTCPLHMRFCTFLAFLVSSTGMSLRCSVLSRIRVRGSCWTFSAPQALFRSWCRLQSGYTWISHEFHAVHVMLVPGLSGVAFLGGPAHRHRAGEGHVHREHGSP